MSIKLMSQIWDIEGLSPGDKLVLLALADQAGDDGWNCWPAVSTIARRSGQGERTVRRCLADLEKHGHITRHHRDGNSTQYHVHPCQIGTPAKTAPLPKRQDTPAKLATTPAKLAYKPSRNTNETPPIKTGARELPDDWEPLPFGETTQSRKVVDSWPPGELKCQVEHFRAHHGKKSDKFSDWQQAWATWVLNTRKFGIGKQDGRINSLGRTGTGQADSSGIGRTGRAALAAARMLHAAGNG